MGCISARVTRVSEPCDLNVTKTGRLRVVISNVFTLVTAAITFVSTMIVNITRTPSQVAVNVSPKERPVVNVGMVLRCGGVMVGKHYGIIEREYYGNGNNYRRSNQYSG